MSEGNGKRTCGTCAACQMMVTAAVTKEFQFQCRRHPPTPILHPIGAPGPKGTQLGVTGMWPVINPQDDNSFCLDWLDPEPRV